MRASSGLTETKYRYTGQLAQDVLELDYYVARWYDPVLSHFVSADIIIPSFIESKSWNRYSYVIYNPIILNDPFGSKPCNEQFGCEYIPTEKEKVKKLKEEILQKTGIIIQGENWKYSTLHPILSGTNKMIKGLDSITGGGSAWIKKNLGGTSIYLGNPIDIPMNFSFVNSQTVYLSKKYVSGGTGAYINNSITNLVIHELGHVWDNNLKTSTNNTAPTGFPLSQSIWVGGGASDELMKFVGGKSTGFFRWERDSLELKEKFQFGSENGFWYGNNSPADYFAHTFAAAICSPNNSNTPMLAEIWMSSLISMTK